MPYSSPGARVNNQQDRNSRFPRSPVMWEGHTFPMPRGLRRMQHLLPGGKVIFRRRARPVRPRSAVALAAKFFVLASCLNHGISVLAFSPSSRDELVAAIDECRSPTGCPSQYGNMPEWDTSKVSDMSSSFLQWTTFNEDISRWDVARVTTMESMFEYASNFNANISKWDVSAATTMNSMFQDASNFDSDLSSWDTSNVVVARQMFNGSMSSSNYAKLAAWDLPLLQLPITTLDVTAGGGVTQLVDLRGTGDEISIANVKDKSGSGKVTLTVGGSKKGLTGDRILPAMWFARTTVSCTPSATARNANDLKCTAPKFYVENSCADVQCTEYTCSPTSTADLATLGYAVSNPRPEGHTIYVEVDNVVRAFEAYRVAETPTALGTVSCIAGFGAPDQRQGRVYIECLEDDANFTAHGCEACGLGTYSDSVGQQSCKQCEEGTVASSTSQITCDHCSPGFYQDEIAQTACKPAPSGSHVLESRAVRADPCPVGEFTAVQSQQYCTRCADDASYGAAYTTLGEGATACNACVDGYFMNLAGECKDCSSAEYDQGVASCAAGSTLELLDLVPGYTRTASDKENVYECPVGADQACRGGTTTGQAACFEGYEGPLCAVCEDGWYHTLEEGKPMCLECGGGLSSSTIFVIIVVALAVLVLGVHLFRKRCGKASMWANANSPAIFPTAVLRSLAVDDGGSDNKTDPVSVAARTETWIAAWSVFKIGYPFIQTCLLMPRTLDQPFPPVYQAILEAITLVSLDMAGTVPLACLTGSQSYVYALVGAGALPIICLLLVAMMRFAASASRAESWERSLFVLYVFFPSVAMAALASFRPCHALDDGESYMKQDYSTTCGSGSHGGIVFLSLALVVVFPLGVPALFVLLLRKNLPLVVACQQLSTFGREALLGLESVGLRSGARGSPSWKLSPASVRLTVAAASLRLGSMLDLADALEAKAQRQQRDRAALHDDCEGDENSDPQTSNDIHPPSGGANDKITLALESFRNELEAMKAFNARSQQALPLVGVRTGAAEEMRGNVLRPWLELEIEASQALTTVVLKDVSLPYRGLPLATFSSLFKTTRVWWWDAFDAIRRVLLNAGLLFLQGNSVQVLLGLLIQMVAAIVAMHEKPCAIGWCDGINVTTQWALFFLYLFVLLEKVDVTGDSASAEGLYGVVLAVIAVGVPAALAIRALRALHLRHEAERRQAERAMAGVAETSMLDIVVAKVQGGGAFEEGEFNELWDEDPKNRPRLSDALHEVVERKLSNDDFNFSHLVAYVFPVKAWKNAEMFDRLRKLAQHLKVELEKEINKVVEEMIEGDRGRELMEITGVKNREIDEVGWHANSPLFVELLSGQAAGDKDGFDTEVLPYAVRRLAQVSYSDFEAAVSGVVDTARRNLGNSGHVIEPVCTMEKSVKGAKRMVAKVRDELARTKQKAGAASSTFTTAKIGDALRATVMVESAAAACEVVKAIRDSFTVFSVRNKFASWERKKNDGGGRFEFPNVHMNAIFKATGCAPIVVEIQVHHKQVMQLGAKDHKLYEIKRAKSIQDLL